MLSFGLIVYWKQIQHQLFHLHIVLPLHLW
jgi:hypothetical protein